MRGYKCGVFGIHPGKIFIFVGITPIMTRVLILHVGVCLALGACTQRTICPAFQSAFIYDKNELRKKFSYFQEDSTPKILTASKTKYLIAEPVSYSRKVASLQTIEMKDVYPVVPDSLSTGGDDDVSLAELDRAARSVIDSTYIVDTNRPPADSLQATGEDSVYVITKDKEVRMLRFKSDSISYKVDEVRYNTDQDNYMWYLRDVLVLPDVRLAKLQGNEKDEKARKEKKGIKGFFKNLFKKKEKKAEVDSTQVEPVEEKSEFDFDYTETDSVSTTPGTDEEVKEKKSVIPFGKKDKASKRVKKPARDKSPKKKEEQPAEKEEPVVEKEKLEVPDDEGGF